MAYEGCKASDFTHLVLKLNDLVQKKYAPRLLTNVDGADLVAGRFFPDGQVPTFVATTVVVGKFKLVTC